MKLREQEGETECIIYLALTRIGRQRRTLVRGINFLGWDREKVFTWDISALKCPDHDVLELKCPDMQSWDILVLECPDLGHFCSKMSWWSGHFSCKRDIFILNCPNRSGHFGNKFWHPQSQNPNEGHAWRPALLLWLVWSTLASYISSELVTNSCFCFIYPNAILAHPECLAELHLFYLL